MSITPLSPGLDQKIDPSSASSTTTNVRFGGTKMAITEVIEMMFMMRAEVMAGVASDRADTAQSRLKLIQQSRSFASRIGELKEQAGDDGTSEMPADMKAFFQEHNIKWDQTGGDDLHKKDEWDINKQYLNDFIDKQSSNNDIEMIKLKSAMNKSQEATQGLDSVETRRKEMMSGIMGNMAR